MIQNIITTHNELDALPVGSIVMTLWDEGPLHYVMQRYSDGWYGGFSDSSLFPLGSTEGNSCLLLWHPDWINEIEMKKGGEYVPIN